MCTCVCVYSTPPQRRRLPACLAAFIICKFQLFAQIRRTRSASNNNNPLLLLLLLLNNALLSSSTSLWQVGIAAPAPLLLLLLPSSIGRRTTNVQFNFCASFALLRSLCVCVCVPRLSANRKSHNIIYCINASRCLCCPVFSSPAVPLLPRIIFAPASTAAATRQHDSNSSFH